MGKSQDLIKEMRYVDGVTIIDSDGIIMYSIKFNPSFHPGRPRREEIIGKTLKEAFPNIEESTSTLYQAMKKREVVVRDRQKIEVYSGTAHETMNASFPIILGNNVVGAIELSQDITDEKTTRQNLMQIDRNLFRYQVDSGYRIGSDKARFTLDHLVTRSPEMVQLKERVRTTADTPAPCFIYGETGTGKEILAHSIHNMSRRQSKPFITQNCAAIPENLLESILFGTVKGSYTGAIDAAGLFELANGGTIFLDEINSMPLGLQAKLLRVLDDGFIRRVGASSEKHFDVRIIAASNQNPAYLLETGQLRRDIYHRICVLYFRMPPLRERPEDIQLLGEHFLQKYNEVYERNVTEFSTQVRQRFRLYEWPGNVRELEHFIQFGVAHTHGEERTLQLHHVEPVIPVPTFQDDPRRGDGSVKPLGHQLEALEKTILKRTIGITGGNVSKAARMLEIPRQTLSRKLKKYGVNT